MVLSDPFFGGRDGIEVDFMQGQSPTPVLSLWSQMRMYEVVVKSQRPFLQG